MRERPQYEICRGCGSPDVDGSEFCASCQKLEMDAQRVDSTDRAIEHGMGIEPFRPVRVPRPPMVNPAALAIIFRREARKDILAAAGIEDYDTGAVCIDRTKDARDEAWLKRTIASIPGQHPKP